MSHDKESSSIQYKIICDGIRHLIEQRDFKRAEEKICDLMKKWPHSPEPHNFMGIFLELQNDHSKAMKHFRASWALDPTYKPVKHNLQHFGTFYSKGRYAFDERDCASCEDEVKYKIEYDANGIGRMVRSDES
ncbi:hypothetical protein [Amphibacillus jilinensis]|uniref:hypothetical protein n=1 Tax=Amphibacillus jilinensis TaxID=1216008 RepID=UPI000307D78A|nr:hypothetical protein [Amphibacillus jilinensis]